MNRTTLSPALRRELQSPAPVGQRHQQVVRLACRLLATGLGAETTFHEIRRLHDPATMPDAEIQKVILWAQSKNPTGFFPNGLSRWKNPAGSFSGRLKNPTGDTAEPIRRFLAGFTCGEADFFDASPVQLPVNYRLDASWVLENLYSPEEKLNIVTQFRVIAGEKGSEKASPMGFGITKTVREWLEQFRKGILPEGKAGVWFRINPLSGAGITDDDVSAFRFVLIESDFLPIETQLALLGKMPIPISAIVTSGGKSLHAWVRIGANSLGEYRESVRSLFTLLHSLGFDTSNRNPSRLSRLPGVRRVIGGSGEGRQRLLYLNPHPSEEAIIHE